MLTASLDPVEVIEALTEYLRAKGFDIKGVPQFFQEAADGSMSPVTGVSVEVEIAPAG